MRLRNAGLMLGAVVVTACSNAQPGEVKARSADVKAIEAAAHGGYVSAINSNDVERLMAVVTDDVVYQAPGAPEVVGKPAVKAWVAGYFNSYRTKWDKTSINFTVSGDWAFERYTYRSSDTDKKTGAVITDIGKGINVYRRGSDGKWRVAIDGWSSDKPAG